MKNKTGFTLAEMVAVIAIMAFLALISVPYIKGYIDDSYNSKAIVHMREIYGNKYKIGLYSGRNAVGLFYWENLDYIKMGPYMPKYGPLNKPTTNQRLFKRIKRTVGDEWEDITSKFWEKETV